MDLKGLCTDCPKRNKCVELCGTARAYADQDYVGRDDLPLGDILFVTMPGVRVAWDLQRQDPRELSKMQAVGLRGEGKSYRQIGAEMGVSYEIVRQWCQLFPD